MRLYNFTIVAGSTEKAIELIYEIRLETFYIPALYNNNESTLMW